MIPDFATEKEEHLFYMREIIVALNLTNGALCQDPKEEPANDSNTWKADNSKEIAMAEEIYNAIKRGTFPVYDRYNKPLLKRLALIPRKWLSVHHKNHK